MDWGTTLKLNSQNKFGSPFTFEIDKIVMFVFCLLDLMRMTSKGMTT